MSRINAGDLLGKVQKITPTGGHQPNRALLAAPIEDKDGRGRAFCQGCGHYSVLSQKGVQNLSRKASLENRVGRYFIVDRCLFCAEKEGFVNPREIQIQ